MANNIELMDMIEVYYESRKNGAESARLYAQRFPNRPTPNRQKFSRVAEHLRSTGSLSRKKRIVQAREDLDLTILLSIQENSRTSLRELAMQHETSESTVARILRKHKFKPYKVSTK